MQVGARSLIRLTEMLRFFDTLSVSVIANINLATTLSFVITLYLSLPRGFSWPRSPLYGDAACSGRREDLNSHQQTKR